MEFDPNMSHKLWHSYYGVLFIKKELNITDPEVLSAIYYHTTGRANMTNLEKLIYISDFTETNTRLHEVFTPIREASFKDLDKAVALEAKFTVDSLNRLNVSICKDTIDTYNYYKKYLENN